MFGEIPEWLDEVAADAWARIVEECRAVGANVEGKMDVIERYAVAYSNWRKCQEAIAEEGQTVINVRENGADQVRNPRMVDLHQLTASLGRLRAELGLSPTKAKPRAEVAGEPREAEGIVYKFPR